jgi:hypothetical protein
MGPGSRPGRRRYPAKLVARFLGSSSDESQDDILYFVSSA